MEHELEKLVSRYQKAAERKQYWEPHWRECYEYAFPLGLNHAPCYALHLPIL